MNLGISFSPLVLWCAVALAIVLAALLFFGVLATVSQGRLVPVPGGVLIKDAADSVLGAVGISGDTSDKDEVCAVAGIEAAGLKAVVGA